MSPPSGPLIVVLIPYEVSTALFLVAAAAGFTLAALIQFGATWTDRKGSLTLLLFMEAAFMLSLGLRDLLGPDDPAMRRGFRAVSIVAAAALPLLYTRFYGRALDTVWARPFSGAGYQRWSLMAVVLIEVVVIGFMDRFVSSQGPDKYVSWYLPMLYGLYGASTLYGLVCAIGNYRSAPTTGILRQRARAYVLAFGIRDAVFAAAVVTIIWSIYAPLPAWLLGFISLTEGLNLYIAGSFLAYFGLLGYGIFRVQVLDLDFHIRRGVGYGFVGALFIGAFFFVTEGAVIVLEGWSGSAWVGLLGAAVMVPFFAPLHRAGDRLARWMMPTARPLGELRAEERVALYRDQLRAAWGDGNLRAKERRMLEVARERLGVSAEDAMRLEAEVVA